MKICIDPGHSGPFEPGACAGGRTEAEFTLQIAQCVKSKLELRGHGVSLTRAGQVADSELAWRAELANNWGADLFISIHCNSAERVDAEGTETYHYPGSSEGLRLAGCIQQHMTEALLTEDRGVKEANFQVLRETDCPAVLVECGFISNPVDRAMLADPQEQEKMGLAVAAGVEDYEKKPEKMIGRGVH